MRKEERLVRREDWLSRISFRHLRYSYLMPERAAEDPLGAVRKVSANSLLSSCTGALGWNPNTSAENSSVSSCDLLSVFVKVFNVCILPGAKSEAHNSWRALVNCPSLTLSSAFSNFAACLALSS